MHDAADDSAIVRPLDAPDICRQVRLDPLPLLIAQPKQVAAHDPNPLPKTNQDRIVRAEKLMSSDPSSHKAPIQPWHTAPHNYRMLRSSTGRFWMRKISKISLCAIAAAMVAIGFGVWNASSGARAVAPPLGQGIDPHQMMMNSKGVPTAEFVDYTFVFN